MKKLAVFVTMIAIATFMAVAMTSADGRHWKHWWGIQGTWEMSASGSCLHSSLEYLPNAQRNNWWTAPVDSKVYAGVTVANGTWTFESTGWNTGEGTYSQRIYATILPGGADSMPVQTPGGVQDVPVPLEVRVLPPLSVEQPTPVAFTYEITPSGDITVTETVSGIKLYGSISIDKKAMTLLSANNKQDFGRNLFGWTICNFARTLIKVNGVHE